MKRATQTLLILITFMLSGCALSDSVRARTMLQNCNFAIQRVDLSILKFAPTIEFSDKGKTVNVNNPPVAELLKLIPQITKGEFDLDFSKITLQPRIAVDNPNELPVILDSMVYEVFLDDAFLMNAEHNNRVTIPAKKSGFVTVDLTIPTSIPLNEMIEAKTVTLKGKAYLKLNITSKKSITFPVPIDVTQDVPRDQINAKLDKEKERLVSQLLKSVKNKGAKNILKSLF